MPPMETAVARKTMWLRWRKQADLPGNIAVLWDEELLRQEVALQPYWRARDWGFITRARAYLEAHRSEVRSAWYPSFASLTVEVS